MYTPPQKQDVTKVSFYVKFIKSELRVLFLLDQYRY